MPEIIRLGLNLSPTSENARAREGHDRPRFARLSCEGNLSKAPSMTDLPGRGNLKRGRQEDTTSRRGLHHSALRQLKF